MASETLVDVVDINVQAHKDVVAAYDVVRNRHLTSPDPTAASEQLVSMAFLKEKLKDLHCQKFG